MSLFNKFSKVFDIHSEEDFVSSQFYGCEDLLETVWDNCYIACSEDDDSVSELYYFIEDCFEPIKYEGNMVLGEMDGVKVVLFNDYENLAIITRKKDVKEIDNFI